MLQYIRRKTQTVETEKVYGQKILSFFLKGGIFSSFLQFLATRISWISSLYGFIQKQKFTRKKIQPFIEAFDVDASEFEKPVEEFESFNDFFIRKLKSQARSVDPDPKIVCMPADGRYLVFPNIDAADGFWVKGKKFSLASFLQDPSLAEKYQKGSMVIARLAPPDYHRFHFPINCIPSVSKLINGPLMSVNPLFLKKNISILSENKRVITPLNSERFGEVQMVEIGATNVGTIHQTYTPDKPVKKGEEKGYFSFGGSCIVLLFEPNRIEFDTDLIEASMKPIEVRSIFGDSLAKSKSDTSR